MVWAGFLKEVVPGLEEESLEGVSCAHLGLQKPHVAQLIQEAYSAVDSGPDAKANSLDGNPAVQPLSVALASSSLVLSFLFCDGGTQA